MVVREEWLFCPACKSKTRDMVAYDTILVNYPLFCPKCKHKTIISAKQFKITIIRGPVAQSQGR